MHDETYEAPKTTKMVNASPDALDFHVAGATGKLVRVQIKPWGTLDALAAWTVRPRVFGKERASVLEQLAPQLLPEGDRRYEAAKKAGKDWRETSPQPPQPSAA